MLLPMCAMLVQCCWLHRASTAHGTVWTIWNTSSSDPIVVISFRPQSPEQSQSATTKTKNLVLSSKNIKRQLH
ncbi:hypothetical protein BDP81DRAFT_441674 [Colletotrichum phormii]|uniref:Secreted protein n=1 Tax=Colletotrichum phormii TaxID=359342 RepID=A0AAI9ZDW7_9PEZI|nr:uncharacterized protein BDP81DRAFT_441674 [Colletotrichum phormii]KAK1622423.1 hypothetical protein BDP81DRAFT_441674 [Colletotrichum phormii]